MEGARQSVFQILTKWSSRLRALSAALAWPHNVWMGVPVENDPYAFRIDDLRATGAKVKFLSLEPLLGPLPDLNLAGIDWVIVSGESGPKARQMKAKWALDIRDQCVAARVPFFFKQRGCFDENGKRVGKKKAGRLLEAACWRKCLANR
jgi:protein gp37